MTGPGEKTIPPPVSRAFWPEALLLLLASSLVLVALGRDAIRDFDEAAYARIARGMARGGPLLSPQLDGAYYPDKPPLLYWLMAGSMRLFGVNAAAARLPSALLGIAGVVAAYLIGRRLRGREAGLVAALALATSPFWLEYSREAMMDVALTTALAFALLGLLRQRSLLFGLALGTAAMFKGPAAVSGLAVACAAAVFDWRRFGRTILLGLPVAALVALPWHLHQLALHGAAFGDYYLGFNVLARFSTPLEGHRGPIWYHLHRLFTNRFAPLHWLSAFLLVPFTIRAFREQERTNDRLLALAFWVPLLIFSIARTRLAWYSLPVVPPMMVIAAAGAVDFRSSKRWLAPFLRVGAILAIVYAGFAVATGEHRNDRAEETRSALSQLPPKVQVPELWLAGAIPGETAAWYADRPIRRCQSGATCPAGAWVLASSAGAPGLRGRPIVSSVGERSLFGPQPERELREASSK